MVPATVGAGVAAGPAPMPAATDGHAAATPLPPEMGAPKSDFMQTIWALCDKNGLDRKGQGALMLAVASLAAFAFAMLLTRCTETRTDLSTSKTMSEWYWWLGFLPGVFFLFVSILQLALVVVSFAKMHVFLRYAVFAGVLWGLLTSVFLFFYFVYIALIAGETTSGIRIEYGVGIGTYLAFLSSLGVLVGFAILAIPHVTKLVKKQPAAA
jgi:hypothetical protein